MYSYQHRYHAGSLADLHKHVILLAVLHALRAKASPFCVLDAFAGEGLYDLNSKESQKNQEYLTGFAKVRKADNLPLLLEELCNIAKSHQLTDKTFMYPGSPAIIAAKLRGQDRGVFIENHPQAYQQLRRFCGKQPQLHLHKREAYEAVPALLPLPEKRGMIFLDPSYEVKDEYTNICQVIGNAYPKFSNGIYVLWYPLLAARSHRSMRGKLQRACGEIKLWQHELAFPSLDDAEVGLQGSGIIIINPPWKFGEIVLPSLEFLQNTIEPC